MRRAEEIAKLEETAATLGKVIEARRREIDEDPLFIHPAEVKQRIESLEVVQRSLRPAPIVLHLDGLRVKIPYEEWKDQLANIDIFGHKLGEVTAISSARIGGSTIMKILTKSEVEAREARKSAATA
jgi:methyl coenzyme M reductase subunit C-like uncharacterized protein (methanogenesis marker protein 7)